MNECCDAQKVGQEMSNATNTYYLSNVTTDWENVTGYYKLYSDEWNPWLPYHYTFVYRGEEKMDKTQKILEIVTKMSELGLLDLKKMSVESFIKLMNELSKIL